MVRFLLPLLAVKRPFLNLLEKGEITARSRRFRTELAIENIHQLHWADMTTEPGTSRPYRWAKSVYLIAWIGMSMKWCGEVNPSASSTEPLAYFFIPIYAAVYALPFALLGYVLGGVRRKIDDSGADPEGEQDE